MHLSLGNHGRDTQQQQEAREARRLFRECTRTDWDFPPLPAYQSDHIGARVLKDELPRDPEQEPEHDPQAEREPETVAGFKIHSSEARNIVDQIIPEVAEWQERDYGSSGSDYDVSDTDGSLASERLRSAAQPPAFTFESPETVKQELADRRKVRRLKRQRLLTEEMEWNTGLEHFIARRDAWTGAKTRTEVHLLRAAAVQNSVASDLTSSTSATPSPRSSTSAGTEMTLPSRPSTAMTSPDPTASSIPTLEPVMPELLIPRMTRVLAAHPIRKKIGPSMYSEIYSKIILQSRTPSISINLLNLTRALVAGWKADGEWPPRPSMPEPSVGRRRAGLKEGVKAAARVLKITSSDVVAPREEKKKAAG